VCLEYLERYYVLITFTAFLFDPAMGPAAPPPGSFGQWAARRPELRRHAPKAAGPSGAMCRDVACIISLHDTLLVVSPNLDATVCEESKKTPQGLKSGGAAPPQRAGAHAAAQPAGGAGAAPPGAPGPAQPRAAARAARGCAARRRLGRRGGQGDGGGAPRAAVPCGQLPCAPPDLPPHAMLLCAGGRGAGEGALSEPLPA